MYTWGERDQVPIYLSLLEGRVLPDTKHKDLLVLSILEDVGNKRTFFGCVGGPLHRIPFEMRSHVIKGSDIHVSAHIGNIPLDRLIELQYIVREIVLAQESIVFSTTVVQVLLETGLMKKLDEGLSEELGDFAKYQTKKEEDMEWNRKWHKEEGSRKDTQSVKSKKGPKVEEDLPTMGPTFFKEIQEKPMTSHINKERYDKYKNPAQKPADKPSSNTNPAARSSSQPPPNKDHHGSSPHSTKPSEKVVLHP